jgi:hypothetical protein
MQTRILPRAEYGRLVGTELEAIADQLPETAHVIVVEDGPELLACWALLTFVHAECVWITPSARGNPRVMRRLLAGMKQTALAMGAQRVWTAALTDHVADLCGRIGGVELPGRHFGLPLT